MKVDQELSFPHTGLVTFNCSAKGPQSPFRAISTSRLPGSHSLRRVMCGPKLILAT